MRSLTYPICCIALAFAFSSGASAQEQHPTRTKQWQQLLERGEITALQDSLLSSSSFSVEESSLVPYYRAMIALSTAHFVLTDTLLLQFPQAGVPATEASIARILSAASRFDFETMRKELDELQNGAATLGEETQLRVATLRSRVERIERMSQNMRNIKISKAAQTQVEELDKQLASFTQHLGTITKHAYTTSNNDQRWDVVATPEGGTTFKISYLMGDGRWDQEEPIVIKGLSSSGRVSYPFLMPDGATLYFSYSGPETMGRSDLYVSRYDHKTRELLVPQQLPIPYNSVADDLFYIHDEERGKIYYATDRMHGPRTCVIAEVAENSVNTSAAQAPAELFATAYPALPDFTAASTLSPNIRRNDTAQSKELQPLLILAGKKIYNLQELKSGSASLAQRYQQQAEEIAALERDLTKRRNEYNPKGSGELHQKLQKDLVDLETTLYQKQADLQALLRAIAVNEGILDAPVSSTTAPTNP